MKIPIKYNLRSLWVRKAGTAMTALGIGLTVAIIVVITSMVSGLNSTFKTTGDPLQLVVLRKGAQNEVNSYFSRDLFDIVRVLPGIAIDAAGEPLAIGEIQVVINPVKRDGKQSNVVVRGASDLSFSLRPDLQIVEGRSFRKGAREIIVSRSMAQRFQNMGLGEQLIVDNNSWDVVGIFDTSGNFYNSEIWGDYDQIGQAWRRTGICTSILLRAESAASAAALIERIADDQRIQLEALPQPDYFAVQSAVSSIGLVAMGTFIALIIGIGSCFAIMNMMYGAVMARQQEIATLRALGFRRRSILASFLSEAAALSLLGGVVGCLLGSMFHGYSAGTTNFSAFSEVVFDFRITPSVLLAGCAFAFVTGVLGGFLPAWRAASVNLVEVLRK